MAFCAALAALETAIFSLAFSAADFVWSLSILAFALANASSMTLLAANFWSFNGFPGMYWASIALIPASCLSLTSWAFSARSIAFCAFWASKSTLADWVALAEAVNPWSLLIASLIVVASALIAFLAFSLTVVNSAALLFLTTALIASTPATLALLIVWASVADLIASLAALAASSTDCFALAFSGAVKFLAWSIEALAAATVSSIILTASALCTCNFSPLICWASIALIPATSRSLISWAFLARSTAFWAFWSSALTFAVWVALVVSLKEVSLAIIFLIVAASWASISLAACFCVSRSLPDRCCAWRMLTPFTYSSWTAWASVAASILSKAFCFCASTALTWSALVLSSRTSSLLISSLTISASSLINCLAYSFWSAKEIKLVTYLELIAAIPFSRAILIPWAFTAASILSFALAAASSTAADCSALALLSNEESLLIQPFTFDASRSIRSLASWRCWSKLEVFDWWSLLIAVIPSSVAAIIAWAEDALSILFFAIISSASTAAFWEDFSVSVNVVSAEMADLTVLASWLILAFADCLCSSKEVPDTWSALIALIPSFNAFCTSWALEAKSILSLAAWASISTLAFWLALSELNKVVSVSISPLTLTTSWSIRSLASCFWSDNGTSLRTWSRLIALIPWSRASIIPCASVAASILFLASVASLSTLRFWAVFSAVVKASSASISPLTSTATWSIRSLALCFWSAIGRVFDWWSALIFSIPRSRESIIPCASEAKLIFCFASAASLSTLTFWAIFSELVNVISASISVLTSLATWSIRSFAVVFWLLKSVPGLWAALILFLPSATAWITSSGVFAASIAVLASVTAWSTSCFCLFFSAVVKFWSASIWFLTESASLAISCFALFFWLLKSLPGW